MKVKEFLKSVEKKYIYIERKFKQLEFICREDNKPLKYNGKYKNSEVVFVSFNLDEIHIEI